MVKVVCGWCKGEFNKAPRDIRRFPHSFCCMSCRNRKAKILGQLLDYELSFVFDKETVKHLPTLELCYLLGCGPQDVALVNGRAELTHRKIASIKPRMIEPKMIQPIP